MVSKKRLSYGFNGFRAPIIPKAPRSIRRRGPRKDLVKDSELCGFDLLAAVAGKLLQESESSASSNVADGNVLGSCRDDNAKQQFVEHKTLNSQSLDHGSCAESAFVPEISFQEPSLLSSLPQPETNSISEQTSALSSSTVKKVDCVLGICEGKNQKVEYEPEMHSEDNKIHPVSMSIVKDPVDECANTNNPLVKSEDSLQLPLYSNPIPDAEQPKHWNNVKLGIRDDDDNYFWCSKSSTKIRSHLLQPRFGHSHSRIRKMFSKYRRDCQLTSEAIKSFHRYRKRIYTVGRCQQAPMKKRKQFGHSSGLALDRGTRCSSISKMGVAACVSATARDLVKSKDRHVKFRINTFKVPEVCIEVPENASVGSLKKAVVEAVTKILGGGIQVGVVLRGKKVRGNHKTLVEAGICESSNLKTLGFMLEPNLTHVSPALPAKKFPSPLACDPDKDLQRSPATPMVIDSGNLALVDPSIAPKLDDNACNDEFKSFSQTSMNEETDATVSDSRALVPVPPIDAEALAAIPINQKLKSSSEHSQRRTRRPFSVAEVEALVEAVEKLGTGRWRDVKIGAFEHADHRTYVDLKDKWKTLVHTASIAPQQRRGEPVPQELLDRVLAAHSYWSQHQSKQQHGKSPAEPLPLKVEGCDDLVKA